MFLFVVHTTQGHWLVLHIAFLQASIRPLGTVIYMLPLANFFMLIDFCSIVQHITHKHYHNYTSHTSVNRAKQVKILHHEYLCTSLGIMRTLYNSRDSSVTAQVHCLTPQHRTQHRHHAVFLVYLWYPMIGYHTKDKPFMYCNRLNLHGTQ